MASLRQSVEKQSPYLPKNIPTRFESFKGFIGGLVALALIVVCLKIGHLLPIHGRGALVVAAPLIIYFSLVSLLLPQSMLGTKIHERLNALGLLLFAVGAIGLAIWMIWNFVVGF